MPRKRQSPYTGRSNRTDLIAPRTPGAPAAGQGAAAFTGLPYGENERITEAQRAMPAPDVRTAVTPGQAAVEAAKRAPAMPNDMLYQPTAWPDEPVTAGVPIGPGPGPEALPPNLAPPPPISDLERMRPYLPTLELMASQPNASPSFRNWVRRLRAAGAGPSSAGVATRSPATAGPPSPGTPTTPT